MKRAVKRKAKQSSKKKPSVKREIPAKKEIISSPSAPTAIGPYSQGVKVGKTVYLSGQIPINPATGELVPGGIREQTERVLNNVAALVTAAGGTLANVVKSTVYLTDLGMFQEMNSVYSQYFKVDMPARVTIQVAGLPKGALVEIDTIVVL